MPRANILAIILAAMTASSVLVLSRDADEYLPLLAELAAGGTSIAVATDARSARTAWNGQEILLGQPDLVAEVLPGLPGVR